MYAMTLQGHSRIQNLDDDIKQSLYVILMIQKGEKIGDPDFGCNALDWLDSSQLSMQKRIVEIHKAIEKYEKRIKVEKINFEHDETGHVMIQLEYKVKGVDEINQLEIGG